MGFTSKLLLFLILSASNLSSLKAQDSADVKKRFIEKGFLLGAGYGLGSAYNLPEGKYIPVFFIGHFGMVLQKKEKVRKDKAIFTMYFEPQVNPVFIKTKEFTKSELEFGVNVGFKHMYPLCKNIYSYILIGSGPHFFTASTSRQARGFIFSDNFGAGLYFFAGKKLAINLGFRLRHMSNANTRVPNHGINTYNYHLGISKLIR
jgi:Lipid A 3-O-deacylase (PagL)